MELIENLNGRVTAYFPQREFWLFDDQRKAIGTLMAMEIEKKTTLDLTVMIMTEHWSKGYGTEGVRLMIKWAAQNGYKNARLTNLFGVEAVEKIAKKLGFCKTNEEDVWNKSLEGPLNI